MTTGEGVRPCTWPPKVAVRQQLTCVPSPLQLTADCGTVYIHRRRDGAQGWCGPAVCIVRGEQFLGRNETIWVHVRNCLHTCNRTHVRPAPTDPTWSGIGYKNFLRTCVVEDCNTTQTSLQKRNLTRTKKWYWTRVFQMSDKGAPTLSLNLTERPFSRRTSLRGATDL